MDLNITFTGKDSVSSGGGVTVAVVCLVALVGLALLGLAVWVKQKRKRTVIIPTVQSVDNKENSLANDGLLAQSSVDSFSEILFLLVVSVAKSMSTESKM